MSVFQYNSITLPYALITNFSQEAVYDESNTNKLYTKFDITVGSVFNTNYASTFGGGVTAGMTPAQIMNQVRAALLTPRKTLAVTFAGTNIIPVNTGVQSSVDSKNGPHPQGCSISQLQNATFLVQYRIITHRTETPSGDAGAGATGGGAVISNRWTESQQIDFANFSTRTRRGKIIIRSDNPNGEVPDDVRESMAVVGIPPGFLRESSSYTVSADGLQMDYEVTDKEVFYMPPAPAFRAEGQYVETTAKLGACRYGEVRLTLYGDKGTKQSDLLQTALTVASSHLLGRGALLQKNDKGNNAFARLEASSITVDMYSNRVSVSMKALMAANDRKQFEKNAGFFAKLTEAPSGSTGQTPKPAYDSRGTTNLLLQAANYYDPSATNNAFRTATGNLNRGVQPGQGG